MALLCTLQLERVSCGARPRPRPIFVQPQESSSLVTLSLIVYFTSGLKMSPLFTSSFLIILRYTYSSSIAINRQSSTTGRGQDQSGYRTFGESFRIYIFKLVRFPQFWRFSSWSALNIDFWCQGWRDPQRGAVRGWPLQPDLWRTRGKWKQR